MKPDRTIIRLSFPHPIYGTFTPIRVEYEYPLGPEDNDQDALDDGKARAEAWVTSRYPDPNGALKPTEVSQDTLIRSKQPEQDRIALLIADIYSCKHLKTLESYQLMVKKDARLQAAYIQQQEKLSK